MVCLILERIQLPILIQQVVGRLTGLHAAIPIILTHILGDVLDGG